MAGKINWRIVLFSIIALGCIALTFLVDWYFIIGAVLFMLSNQRELKKMMVKNN